MATVTKITVYKNYTTDHTFTLYTDSDADTGLALAAGDVIRFKIGDLDNAAATPLLDADSVAATANGSVVTITQTSAPATISVRVAQGDLSAAGVYDFDVLWVDDSETAPVDAIKPLLRGQAIVKESIAGDVGKT